MTQENKDKIIKGIQNMPFDTWRSFEKMGEEERAYIIFLCQNQKGSSLEADGISYQPEGHTKFRKIDTSYRNSL